MSSSGNTSSDRFYVGLNGGDGIPEAELAIRVAGGSISDGCIISYEGDNAIAWEAIHFLVWEWDYGTNTDNLPR